METVIVHLEGVPSGGTTCSTTPPGHWIVDRVREQAEVEGALYVAALHNWLVSDDGQRQTWATIRSGLGAGSREPIDLTPTTGRERYPSLSGAAHHAAATLVDEAGCAATQ
jgi:hypothetical protein